jgi:UDP:flavonoid glycosyltransferase YjiC (YdhE family)
VLERIVKGGRPAEGVFDLLLPKRSGAPGQAEDRGLWQWIRQERPRPLIFVSFGTMFRPHLRLYKAMVRGFTEAGVDVLWFLPGRERESLPIGGGSAERIRFVSSVPQADVLAEEAVRLFVTHGGAGGVMEAAEAGKPMVCVPFLWDQPYNSSVVERCGLGLALSKRRVTARSLAAAIRTVLQDPSYARAAAQAAQLLRDPGRQAAMRGWARDVVQSTGALSGGDGGTGSGPEGA